MRGPGRRQPTIDTMTTNGHPTDRTAAASWLERRQVPLCLAAIAIGVAIGLLLPGAPALGVAINPLLGLLLFATFLAVPFTELARGVRDVRFLAALGLLNFVIVPMIVFGLSRLVAGSDALLVGVLLVLLTPCVDYVIVFTGLAGGAGDRLLAAAPLLMLVQLVLLPAYLVLFAGADLVVLVDPVPFISAFLLLIVLPLAAAAGVQAAARRLRVAVVIDSTMRVAMVPLMLATLTVVVASQIRGVGEQLGALAVVIPIFIGFVVVMVPLGVLSSRIARLDVPGSRALVFSGATRNSLVVLPLALALPAPLSLAPLVVVTQTIVELVAMVVLVQLVPRLLPGHRPTAT